MFLISLCIPISTPCTVRRSQSSNLCMCSEFSWYLSRTKLPTRYHHSPTLLNSPHEFYISRTIVYLLAKWRTTPTIIWLEGNIHVRFSPCWPDGRPSIPCHSAELWRVDRWYYTPSQEKREDWSKIQRDGRTTRTMKMWKKCSTLSDKTRFLTHTTTKTYSSVEWLLRCNRQNRKTYEAGTRYM